MPDVVTTPTPLTLTTPVPLVLRFRLTLVSVPVACKNGSVPVAALPAMRLFTELVTPTASKMNWNALSAKTTVPVPLGTICIPMLVSEPCARRAGRPPVGELPI